jgi:hypothetical protein
MNPEHTRYYRAFSRQSTGLRYPSEPTKSERLEYVQKTTTLDDSEIDVEFYVE